MEITQPPEPTPPLPDEQTVRRLLSESVSRTHYLRRLLRLVRLNPGATPALPTPQREAASGD